MQPFGQLFCINLRIECRMWLQFLFEVLIVLGVYIIIILNPFPEDGKKTGYMRSATSNVILLDSVLKPKLTAMPEMNSKFDTIAYAPMSTANEDIAKAVANKLFKITKTKGYASAEQMRNDFRPTYLAGLHINASNKTLKLDINFSNKLRAAWNSSKSDTQDAQQYWSLPTNDAGDSYGGGTPNDNASVYLNEAFVQIQQAVFQNWYSKHIQNKSKGMDEVQSSVSDAENEVLNDDVYTRRKRIAGEKADKFFTEMEMRPFVFYPCKNSGESTLYDLFYAFCFLLAFCNLLWKFASLNEVDIPFQFWCRGLGYAKFWLSQYIVAMMHLFALDIFLMLIVSIDWNEKAHVFRDTDTLEIFYFFFLYNTAMVITAMIIVKVIAKPKDAMLLGASIWLVNYAIFGVYIYRSKHALEHTRIFPIVLFFNNGFGYCMHLLRQHTKDTDYLHLFYCALVGNIIIYFIILIIIQMGKPGLFVESQLCLPCRRARKNDTCIFMPRPINTSVEYGPRDAPVAIRTKNVTTYCGHRSSNTDPHIKMLTLRIFVGEITVLLGSRNSGKTVILSVLGGWKRPAYGKVWHFDTELYVSRRRSSHSRDVMMATNCLVDMLTARESLLYAITQKAYGNPDMDKRYMREEIRKWERKLDDVIENQSILVHKLDYDQKRLLSLCCCLACNTKLILLDEPTSYMRWREQQIFWELLRTEKLERAIVISTTDVSEAEKIGDRIAVLSDGILLAYGSPYYLKTAFGIEDQLVVLIQPDTDVKKITEYLGNHIPGITPENEIGNQVFYNIPYTFRNKYQKILLYLERDKKTLGISNVYMLASELKDVYYRLELNATKIIPFQQVTDNFSMKYKHTTERDLFKQHLRATSLKKLINQTPHVASAIVVIISTLLLPLLYLMYDMKGNTMPPTSPKKFGYNDGATDRTIFSDYKKCNFIEIRGAPTFSKNTLFCGKGDFQTLLQHDRKYDVSDLYGVVQTNASSLNGWYNLNKFRSAPVTLNLMHNMLLKNVTDDAYTTIMNNPISELNRATIWGSARMNASTYLEDIAVPLLLGVMFSYIVAYLVVELANERTNQLMDLYEISGMNMDAYWIISFLWDFGTLFVDGMLFMIVLIFFSMFNYDFANKLFTFVLIVCYSLAIIPNIYVISMHKFESSFRAYICTVLYLHTTGILLFMIHMYVLGQPQVFTYIAMIFPSFALLESVHRLYFCSRVKDCTFESLFNIDEPSVFVPIFYMLGECIFWFVVLYLIHDYRKSTKYKKPKHLKLYRSVIDPKDDPDVIELKRKIASFTRAECLQHRVCVDQVEGFLRKDSRKLDTVSFYIEKHEILCIRGPPRCGKSHLARQLVGIDVIQFGEVYICKMDLSLDISKIHSYIGYCPQDGGLCESGTVRQMLRLFFMIRGMPDNQITDETDKLVLLLNLRTFHHKTISDLSHAEKRKVSIALACVAYNKVMVLDEPTRGMPLHAKREIWNTLRFLRFLGMSIIVITNDTLECQVLSDKMMIFRNYNMLAFNTPYNLLKSYSTHIVLDVRIAIDGRTVEEIETNMQKDIENLRRFARYLHEYSVLVSRMDSWLKFHVPVSNVRYSYIWGALDKNREILNIVEYNVSPCSVDHIMDLLCKKRKEYRMR